MASYTQVAYVGRGPFCEIGRRASFGASFERADMYTILSGVAIDGSFPKIMAVRLKYCVSISRRKMVENPF